MFVSRPRTVGGASAASRRAEEGAPRPPQAASSTAFRRAHLSLLRPAKRHQVVSPAPPFRSPPSPRAGGVAAGCKPRPALSPPVAAARDGRLAMPRAPSGSCVLRWLRRGCVLLAHLAALGTTALLLLLSRPGTSLFSWHPVFMSIAFCLCSTEAILIFSPDCFLFCPCSHKFKIKLHWTAQTLAFVAATVGLAFIISSKNRSELSHFVTWHSCLGLLTFLATCGQVLGGLCLRFPWQLKIFSVAQLRLYHIMCGLVVYLLATFTVILGIYSDWFQAQINGAAWYFCLGLPFCPALVIVNQTTRTHVPQKREHI